MPPIASLRRLTAAVLLAFTALLWTCGAAAHASTSSVSFSADPKQDKPVTVTVSGTVTTSARWLYVTVTAGSCAAAASSNAGNLIVSGTYLAPGSYSQTATWTPSDPGSYHVCAYVSTSYSAPADVVGQGTVAVRATTGTAAVAFSADPTEDKRVTVTVTGTAEVPRWLYVKVTAGSCAASASEDPGNMIVTGSYVAAGAFTETASWTPSEPGTYRICAYVSENYTGTPDAIGSATVTVRTTAATSSVSVSADPAEGKPVALTFTGTSEVPRWLYVKVTAGSCAASASEDPGNMIVTGSYVAAGAFTETVSWTPSEPGTYRVCAYVSENYTGAPDGAAQAEVRVRPMATAVNIAVSRDPYMVGESRTATVTATADGDAWLSAAAVEGSECPRERGGDESVSSRAATTKKLTFTLPATQQFSICATVFVRGQAYATARVVLTKSAVEVPVASSSSPRGAIDTRRPVFGWKSDGRYNDDFVLSDRDGATLLIVGRDGAWVPDGRGDSEEDVDSPDDYYDSERRPTKSSRNGYVKVQEAAAYTVQNGDATVSLTDALLPGGYRWRVERYRADGERVVGPTERFRVKGPGLSRLRVRSKSRSTKRSRRPGSTRLTIVTTPYAYVRVELERAGRSRVMNLRWGASAQGTIALDWTCKRGGGRYRFTVTAADDDGNTLERAGTFRTITLAKCRALRRAERLAAARRSAERRRRERAAARRRAAAERRDLQRRIDNCRAINGQPRRWTWPDGSTSLVCVSPYGVFALD